MGKNAIIDMNLRWPSSTIPYVISASFGELILTLIRLIALYSTYVDDKEFHSRNAGVIGTPLVARLTHECCHKGQSSPHCGICFEAFAQYCQQIRDADQGETC